jgi:DNA-binding NarL/FixJ family response regulator
MPVLGAAHTGQEAVEVTAATRPGVVLVDVSLGDESGFDVARRLNELDAGGVAIILISTRSGAEFAELVEKSPALGFISKSEISADAVRSMVDAVPD